MRRAYVALREWKPALRAADYLKYVLDWLI